MTDTPRTDALHESLFEPMRARTMPDYMQAMRDLACTLERELSKQTKDPMDTSKVTRFEVINNAYGLAQGEGRVYVVGPNDDVKTELSLQDDGRTLKVFIDNRRKR